MSSLDTLRSRVCKVLDAYAESGGKLTLKAFVRHIEQKHGARKLSPQEAADRLGLTRQRVVQLCKTGRLDAERVGSSWVVNEDELAAFSRQERPVGRPRRWS